MDDAAKLETGVTYEDFLAKYGSDTDRRRWSDFHAQVRLSEEQQAILASFVRDMEVIVLAGAWCGDCVNQCPHQARLRQSRQDVQTVRRSDR